jgi:hypothetical protein
VSPRLPQLLLCLLALASFEGGSVLAQPVAGAAQVEQVASTIQAGRDQLGEWMEVQRIISQEQASFKSTQSALQGRIDLVKLELDDFASRLNTSEANIKGEATRKSNLEKELELANKGTQSLMDSASYLEEELKKLKGILPAPIYTKVQALYDRMPADPKTTKVSLAERYQNILGILNEADKANAEITVLAEVRELPGTPATEVETLYVGLAQAYFVNAERNFAGMGRPVNGKWEWTQMNELGGEIAEVLAVMSTKAKPKFVFLPAQLD